LKLVDFKELPARKTEDIAISEQEACVYSIFLENQKN